MSSDCKDLRSIFNDKMREADFLYEGWCNSFVPQMKDELFSALGGYVEDFEVYQIKEKFGTLTIYKGWKSREYTKEEFKDLDNITAALNAIIDKYKKISERTCVQCGGKATFLSDYWVIPWCDSCRSRDMGVYAEITD